MEQWSPQQVSQLIGGLGKADCWEQYSKIALNEDLDGLTFVSINQDSLTKLGFRPLHAEAIVKQRDNLLASPALLVSSASLSPLPPPPPPPAYSVQNNNNNDVSKTPQCSAHNRPFEGYCMQDEQLVCMTCMFSNHQGHRCESVNDVFAKEKVNIEELLKEATERSVEWIKAADSISAMRKQGQLNNDRAVAEIEQLFVQIEKKIRARKQNLQYELQTRMEHKLTKLTKQEDELRNAVKELEKLGGSVKQHLETKSAVECLQLQQEMILHLGDKQGKRRRLGWRRGGAGVRCEPDCEVDMDFFGDGKPIGEMIDGLGRLCCEWAVASRCGVRGSGLETVRAGQTGKFTIVGRNNRGMVVRQAKEQIQVSVTSGDPDEDCSPDVVLQIEETSHELQYTYHIDDVDDAKDLALSVMIRGEHVKGSPFTVKIIQPPQFLPQSNLELTENNTVATNEDQDAWTAGLADNSNKSVNGVLSYRIKIISGSPVLGFASWAIKQNDSNYQTGGGYYLRTDNGGLYSQQQRKREAWLGRPCDEAGTVIDCILDTVKHEIWFMVSGDKPRLAYKNVQAKTTHFAVHFNGDCSVRLLDS